MISPRFSPSIPGLPLVLGSLILSATPMGAQAQTLNSQRLPPAPDTGTPTGNPTPGTTRSGSTCPPASQPLTALVANNGSDLTHVAYPTLWFYVPYAAAQISRLEFVLVNRQETETIYQTVIQLQGDHPGLIKVTIPSEPQYALQPNQTYRWYLNLDCEPDVTVEADRLVDGWMRRRLPSAKLQTQITANTPSAHLLYREQGLWYDAIDHLAQRYREQPGDRTLSQTWITFMDSIGHGQVAQSPFLHSVQLPPTD